MAPFTAAKFLRESSVVTEVQLQNAPQLLSCSAAGGTCTAQHVCVSLYKDNNKRMQ